MGLYDKYELVEIFEENGRPRAKLNIMTSTNYDIRSGDLGDGSVELRDTVNLSEEDCRDVIRANEVGYGKFRRQIIKEMHLTLDEISQWKRAHQSKAVYDM